MFSVVYAFILSDFCSAVNVVLTHTSDVSIIGNSI
jgi:hypothetical protein